MKKSDYQKLIELKLEPKLIKLGFVKVNLENCISNEVLYQKGRLWFGTSWDWRDMYLEVELGHLYWFKDFMPRVIILGSYNSYVKEINKFDPSSIEDLKPIVKLIDKTIDEAINIYNNTYENILSKYIQPKKQPYTKEFSLHLGNEVNEKELSKYKNITSASRPFAYRSLGLLKEALSLLF